MTVKELEEDKRFCYHHTGSRMGYESRRGEGHVETYKGRFYIAVTPRWDTTKYVNVAYYIKK